MIRILTEDPPEAAARAKELLQGGDQLILTDLIVAECVHVLESNYGVEPRRVARLLRSVLALPGVATLDPRPLLRAFEVYETHGIDFPEAYLVALAEQTGVAEIVSFDRSIDRVESVVRRES